MVTGATDGLYLRAIGIPTCGTQGFFMDRVDIRFHERDEGGMGLMAFYEGEVFLHEHVKALTSEARPQMNAIKPIELRCGINAEFERRKHPSLFFAGPSVQPI